METLKMQTKNKVDINIETIGKVFPNTLTEVIKGYDKEGKVIIEKAIDFNVLKQELSKVIVEGREERYQMNWPGKKKVILEANSPINKTLRPCREDSVDFDKTENLYIEGDNLEVLKLLQETYLNRVKLIYIDPPYNTGKDSFVYNDDFVMNNDKFSETSGRYDEEGNILYDIRKNNESNGRFHTDWLNMMYPRLKLAKDLLSEDGVIFISIDDNEVSNLKKICDEIFGESNFVASIIWQRAYAPVNMNKWFSPNHDFALVYAKKIVDFKLTKLPRTEKQNRDYKNLDNDPRGPWKVGNPSVGPAVAKNIYEVTLPSGRKVLPPAGRSWLYSQKRLKELIADNRIYFGKDGDSVWAPKMFLNEVNQGITPLTLWQYSEVGHSQDATKELKKLFDNHSVFDYSKPIEYIKRMVHIGSKKNDNNIILDFFSGSSTTAHAVMQLNAEDGGNRKFIMVQLSEETDKKSEAYKAGYKNICEIGKERIRRAGKKIKEENPDKAEKLDTGFRVLKLDLTNMKDVFYSPSDINQDMVDKLESNIKEDRSSEDLLFQVMLDLGELLSSDIEKIEVGGKKVFNVGQSNIVACFDHKITDEVVIAIAKMEPFYAVFRDSSLINDAVAANFEQMFKTYSPNTIRKIL
ncbi:site-specific DNA-methyltransferase [Clostridium sporogenes]|uniref:site-specific DNA-methyltransferase n=1 Tax=Clostridium sporogenes TaxID=1509 RepID=UPI0013D68577|nr:site-specific DNA-methyltransferase [Clostridium sporogenes]NFV11765.1 site-specific DNA-methyltransferase [Clostridium sporogenes]